MVDIILTLEESHYEEEEEEDRKWLFSEKKVHELHLITTMPVFS